MEDDGKGLNKALIMASVEGAGILEGARQSVTPLLDELRDADGRCGVLIPDESDESRPANDLNWTIKGNVVFEERVGGNTRNRKMRRTYLVLLLPNCAPGPGGLIRPRTVAPPEARDYERGNIMS